VKTAVTCTVLLERVSVIFHRRLVMMMRRRQHSLSLDGESRQITCSGHRNFPIHSAQWRPLKAKWFHQCQKRVGRELDIVLISICSLSSSHNLL